MTDLYAVIGNPVGHSRSPFIHAEFASQARQDMEYEALLAPLNGFVQAVADFRRRGGKGANITIPFKLEACRMADRLTERAEAAQAVNTLTFNADGILGDNTDGAGLVRDLMVNMNFLLKGSRVLLMGAGGAARGVILPLLEQKPGMLVIANRTRQKAYELQQQFSFYGRINSADYAELCEEKFDVVINATSASLQGKMPALPGEIFAPGALAYDMMYADGPTPFLQFAKRQGAARLADGVGMLVEQAAESFFRWRGVRPETAPVIALLRPLSPC